MNGFAIWEKLHFTARPATTVIGENASIPTVVVRPALRVPVPSLQCQDVASPTL
jgi:hypothetical protein